MITVNENGSDVYVTPFTIYRADVPTRRDEMKRLMEIGASEDEAHTLAKISAFDRATMRDQQAGMAALSWVKQFIQLFPGDLDPGAWNAHIIEPLSGFLRAAEVGGLYGGPRFGEGFGPARHPAFSQCGKGRRQASDGPAWTEAIKPKICYNTLLEKAGDEVILTVSWRNPGIGPTELSYTFTPPTLAVFLGGCAEAMKYLDQFAAYKLNLEPRQAILAIRMQSQLPTIHFEEPPAPVNQCKPDPALCSRMRLIESYPDVNVCFQDVLNARMDGKIPCTEGINNFVNRHKLKLDGVISIKYFFALEHNGIEGEWMTVIARGAAFRANQTHDRAAALQKKALAEVKGKDDPFTDDDEKVAISPYTDEEEV